ncbi:MAG: hypothetical protein A4S14_20955 [Proteobacteria bacterium SG_bin9]|nr:MAG: hypothetical protein A4S14_20955 [Proteobacteria bacterium SG_bin9]
MTNCAVADVFESYPPPLRTKLKALRTLILDVAATTPDVGALDEMLKWGQPSYLTTESGSGSTIRIDRVKSATPQYAMYFHCQTDLVETFRQLYPDRFRFEGNRAIIFTAADKLPERELRHCVGLALTYHLRKRKPARTVKR